MPSKESPQGMGKLFQFIYNWHIGILVQTKLRFKYAETSLVDMNERESQIFKIFLCVCQSVGWLTSMLNLG